MSLIVTYPLLIDRDVHFLVLIFAMCPAKEIDLSLFIYALEKLLDIVGQLHPKL